MIEPAMDAQVRVSVVVPTYRRAEDLRSCLAALASQRTAVDEILVSVRGDDHESIDLVRDAGAPVRLVTVERPGVIAAMNAAIDVSSGDIVALTDDDAQPRSDWITSIIAVYDADPRVGAVGGRDMVHQGDSLDIARSSDVGLISWYGKLIGNHHLGVGPPRDVDVLKGVNLSVRGELLRELRIDERLHDAGTARHWEVGLCLAIRRRGYRIVYDPAIVVDHYTQRRVDESREVGPRQARAGAYNETLAVLEHVSAPRRAAHLLWALGVGSRESPGLAQAARIRVQGGAPQAQLLASSLSGRLHACLTACRSHRKQSRPAL